MSYKINRLLKICIFVQWTLSLSIFAADSSDPFQPSVGSTRTESETYQILNHSSAMQDRVNFILAKIGNSDPFVLAEIVKVASLTQQGMALPLSKRSYYFLKQKNLNIVLNPGEDPCSQQIFFVNDDWLIDRNLLNFISEWIAKNQDGIFALFVGDTEHESNYFTRIQDEVSKILFNIRDSNYNLLEQIIEMTFSRELLKLPKDSCDFLDKNGYNFSLALFSNTSESHLSFITGDGELDPCVKKYVLQWLKWSKEDLQIVSSILRVFLLKNF